MKTASAYKALCQEEKLFLQDTAQKVAMLVAKPPKTMDYFRKQLTKFADKWTVYETAKEAERKGKWQPSMGRPSNPLWAIWPRNTGTNCFPDFGDIPRVLGGYALLAVIHDNVLTHCPSTATGILSKELVNKIWRDLVTGANVEDSISSRWVIPTLIIEHFLRDVKTDVDSHLAPKNITEQKKPASNTTAQETHTTGEKGNNQINNINVLSDIANRLDKVLANNLKLKSSIINHVQKITQEATRYSGYINEKYKEAKKDNRLLYAEKPEGANWYSAYNSNIVGIYFSEMITFWQKDEVKTDPLGYLFSMVLGNCGELYKELEIDDYRYFLLTCVHDCQRIYAGQKKICFESQDTEELKNRICAKIWDKINRSTMPNSTATQIAQTLENTLQGLSASGTIAQKDLTDAEQNGGNAYVKKTANIWIFSFNNNTISIADRIGSKYIGFLLTHPGEYDAHILELNVFRWENEIELPDKPEDIADGLEMSETGSTSQNKFDVLLDHMGYCQLRSFIALLEKEQDSADKQSEKDKRDEEIAKIKQHLNKVHRPGGNGKPTAKTFGADQHKAARRIKKNYENILKLIEKDHKELHKHLKKHMDIKTKCSYTPPSNLSWNFF